MQSIEYKQFINTNIGGAAQPQANAGILTSMTIIVPPHHICDRFDYLVEPMIDQAELLAVANQNLRTTRDLLLPKLISGELDVSNMPEPETEAA
jgi:type I restriction enzyme S subunit